MAKTAQYHFRVTPDEEMLIRQAGEHFALNTSALVRFATLKYLADFYLSVAETKSEEGDHDAAEHLSELATRYFEEAGKYKDLKRHAKTTSKRWKLTREWKLKQAG